MAEDSRYTAGPSTTDNSQAQPIVDDMPSAGAYPAAQTGAAQPKMVYRKVAGLAGIIFLPLAVVIIGGVFYFYSRVDTRTMADLRERETNVVRKIADAMIGELRWVSSELMVQAGHRELRRLLDEGSEEGRRALAEEFVGLSRHMGIYDQVRYIDESGMEVVRVNYNAGSPATVLADQLRDKSDRYYFKKAFAMKHGEIYISPLDLNIEDGEVQRPLTPTLRFATPVRDGAGRKRGIMILNYRAARLIRLLETHGTNAADHITMVDSSGYWLRGMRPEYEWGFMFSDRAERTFGNEFPDAWSLISEKDTGQFTSGKGLFTHSKVIPSPAVGGKNAVDDARPLVGLRKSLAQTAGHSMAGNPCWRIVSIVSPAAMAALVHPVRYSYILLGAFLLLPLAVGSWLVSAGLLSTREAREALRDSEEWHRTLIESTSVAYDVVDAEGNVLYASPSVERMLGWTPEEIKAQSIFALVHPEDIEEAVAALGELVANPGQVRTADVRYRHKDGSWRDIHVSGVNMIADPIVKGIVLTSLDVTDRKRADEALVESEEKYRALFDDASDAIFIFDPGTTNILDANAATSQMYGYDNDELMEMSCLKLSNEVKESTEALDRLRKKDRENVPYRLHRKKDGTVFPVDVTGHKITFGGETVMVAVSKDITERKQAEEEIKNLARFPSEDPSPVLRISKDGIILHANPASRSLLDEWKTDEGDRVPEDVAQRVAESYEGGGSLEMDVVTCDKTYSFVLAPVQGEDYVNLYGRDITEHRRLEEQLRHTQKMEAIGLLAGGIAHDFSNLLQGILGYANMLKLQFPDNAKVFKAASIIEQAGTRAGELTQQLLGFARKGKLRDMAVDIHRTVDETVAIFGRAIDKRIVVVQRLGAEPSLVRGDPGQLQQVVMNLAVNARDAMPEGGELTFETSVVNYEEGCRELPQDAKPGVYLLLSVKDTGIGIAPEVRERIFEPFFTTKPQGEGTGMGLAMVYGIVKNHGGVVEVRSEPGKGTTFDIYLPLAEKGARITDTQKLKAVLRSSGRILVVDDEEVVRTILTEMLTSLGYSVHCARDGKEAVEHYQEHASEIDLVLLDMTMPVMDGRQCFGELKKINPDVKVVIATGHALDGAAQETINAGALRFIHKPFLMSELAETVAKALTK